MVKSHSQPWQRSARYFVVVFLPFAVACGSNLKTQSVKVTPATPAAARATLEAPVQQTPVQDLVVTLIAASNDHFQAGQRELEQGHFDAAKVEFDRAVDMLLESPYGARTEPRLLRPVVADL